MKKHNQDSRELWGRLFRPWKKLDDDSPRAWQKTCGFLTAFITEENGEFEFALHGGDDEVLKEQWLKARTIEEAQDESDALVALFVQVGNEILSSGRDEIRLIHAYHVGNSHWGVATDGKLYRYDGSSWSPIPMTKDR